MSRSVIRKWFTKLLLLVVMVSFVWCISLQLAIKVELIQNVQEIVKQYPMKMDRKVERKTILVWNTNEGQMPRLDKFYNFELEWDCCGCHVTTNRSKLRNSNAIIYFNNKVTLDAKDWPDQRTRTADQFYIFNTRETPSKTYAFHNSLTGIDGIFNLTWYFRKDSDIVYEFGSKEISISISHRSEKLNNFTKLLQAKTNLAVWAVSNCYRTYGAAKRMEHAKALIEAGLNLSAFGKCFDKHHKYTKAINNTKYKFYLAFENSLECPDYITEKFWMNSLNHGSVPIVFGPTKDDVLKIAPSKSFIHVDDFSSPKELVDYMNYLDKNDEAYLEYHQWRKIDAKINDRKIGRIAGLCDICKRINEVPIRRRVIPSIIDWMYGPQHYTSGECLKFERRQEFIKQYKPTS